MSHARAVLAAVLIVAGVLVAPAAAVGAWARVALVDTDRFVGTLAPVARDPDVRALVIDRTAAAIAARVSLPASLIERGVTRVVDSNGFATTWAGVLRATHASGTAALQWDGGGVVEIDADGVLQLQLGPVVAAVTQRLLDDGVSAASAIPEVALVVPLVPVDGLSTARTVYAVSVAVGFWLPWIAIGLLVTGVLLARRRLRALTWAAGAVGIVMLVVLIGIRVAGGIAAGAVASDPLAIAAVGAVYDAASAPLVGALGVLAAAGVVVAGVAWAAGESRSAARVRAAVARLRTRAEVRPVQVDG